MRHDRDDRVFYKPVDSAMAVYLGQVLVGHRASVPAGEMFWALPGRQRADSATLKARDPGFRVIAAPTVHTLLRLKRLEAAEANL